MPHDHCPPSRRGHSWRELRFDELPRGSIAALKITPAIRVCSRCGKPGRIDAQGRIVVMEVT